jgi:hypothetical protein
MSLKQTELFENALIEPLIKGANTLYIVSGYATAMMAMRHLDFAKRINKNFAIRLIVGMCPIDGIERKNHNAFIDLQSKKFELDFQCRYVINAPAVHSKVYAWYRNDNPIEGFVGSANYTQNAFSASMREVLTEENPEECLTYYKSVLGETANCANDEIPNFINVFDKKFEKRESVEITEAETAIFSNAIDLPKVTLSLVDRYGEVPAKSGLNWGQRPGREKNQAYLNIPAEIGRTDFFPERFEIFTVVTDDGKQFICVRAQDGGKGLHTTLNNSLIGEYFRFRLGLKNGEFVKKEHLLKYGRSDVDFYKIDDENYYLDFSVH